MMTDAEKLDGRLVPTSSTLNIDMLTHLRLFQIERVVTQVAYQNAGTLEHHLKISIGKIILNLEPGEIAAECPNALVPVGQI